LKILAGLGNPGRSYEKTRHNVGFMAAEEFLRRHGRGSARPESGALVADARWAGDAVLVARPQRYMNDSGPPVAALCRTHGLTPSDLVVAYDDADLPLGQIRVRPDGRPAGHKGIASIVEALGTEQIARVRLGIGRPEGVRRALADHVLAPFESDEEEALRSMIAEAADAIEILLRDGVKTAMNRYNRRRVGDGA
jgi:peptidyl-tRNA hydrolase, PTH1 family